MTDAKDDECQDIWAEHLPGVFKQHKDIPTDYKIVMMANEIDDATMLPVEFTDRAREIKNEKDYHTDAAFETAYEESCVRCIAPMGYLFARLERPGTEHSKENPFYLVLVKQPGRLKKKRK